MESIFVLVGAGASPGISTRFLTEQLLQWRGVLEPVADRSVETPDEGRRPFFEWLVDVSSEVYAPPPPGPFGYYPSVQAPNFEDLLYTVERLAYMMRWHFYDSAYKRPPPYEMPFFNRSDLGDLLHEGLHDSLYDVVVMGSTMILDIVADRAASQPNSDAGHLVNTLRKDGRVLKVFSLNYDSRVVDLNEDWWTGFRALDEAEARLRDTKAGVQIFEPVGAIPHDANSFVQLHGSTYFGWVAHAYRAPRYIVCRHPNQIMDHGTPRRGGFEYLNDRTALPALTLVTGYRKAEKALVEPYSSYFSYLRSEAFRTPYWLILGYGGKDDHVNAILRSAGDYWGDALRAFVCNRGSQNDWSDDEAFAENIMPTMRCLGRGGLGVMRDKTCFASQPFSVNSTTMLSLDGEFERHIDAIRGFLDP